MRRSLSIDAAEVVATFSRSPHADDEVACRILDAAAELYERHGVRRCSVEDIAQLSGVGRTTIYRRFDGHQQILEAVLGREVRGFFASIIAPSAHLVRFDDIVIESFIAGLSASETSLLGALARSEPDLLALLTIDAAPVLDSARTFLVQLCSAADPSVDVARAEVIIDMLVRFAISLVLTPSTLFRPDDLDAARAALHLLLDPLLESLVD